MSVREAAALWDTSERRVQKLCEQGRVEGVMRFGRSWQIPKGAGKPADPRLEQKTTDLSLSEDLDALVTAAYIPVPRNNADLVLTSTTDERVRRLLEIGLAFWHGDFEQTIHLFRRIEGDDAVKLCAGPTVIAAAICQGDYSFYEEVESFLQGFVQTNSPSYASTFAEMALATASMSATAPNMAPEWLKNGDLSGLPRRAKQDALYLRARYFQGMKQYESMLSVAQTSLAFLPSGPGVLYTEINLKIVCAIALNELGRRDEAEQYLLSIIDFCLNNELFMPLTVNLPMAGGLIEQLLERAYPAFYDAVLEQAKRVAPNWVIFHNRFAKENITHVLSPRDYQIARMVAQGIHYKRIAEQFHMSVGTLNNRMQVIYEMLFITGKDRKKELVKYVL